jgi:hypothetical protein
MVLGAPREQETETETETGTETESGAEMETETGCGMILACDRNMHVLSSGFMGFNGRNMYLMGITLRCAHVHGRDAPLPTVSGLHSARG